MEPRSKVLVVDDNQQNRILVETILSQEELYDILLAESGEEALHLFVKERPDCVLLDVRMPGMDGFSVCETIRSMEGGKDLPILFLTALRDLKTFEHALRSGESDFLSKPIRPVELLVRVQSAIRLQRLSADLKDQVEIVKRQRDDLMRLQFQKERLMGFVVHDLKNPLNSIDLAAQRLLRMPEIPDKVRRIAGSIRSADKEMMRLLLNLLDLSRAEEGQLLPTWARVDLKALVTDLCESFSAAHLGSDVRLEGSVDLADPVIVADEELLRRVLENLIDNAVRYAPEGTAIRLSVFPSGDKVEIQVADEGPGVPEDLRQRIFERYIQGDVNQSRRGRGLGLAFSKIAVEAQGGQIGAQSGPGGVFTIRLPRGPTHG